MAIMFVFFATQYGALAILAERRVGTLNRLLAAPDPAAVGHPRRLHRRACVLGLLGHDGAGRRDHRAGACHLGPAAARRRCSWWRRSIAAIGISTLVATLAKTVEQAGGLNAIVALCLSAIGGVFIPLSQAPEVLARLVAHHAARLVPAGDRHARRCPPQGLTDILPTRRGAGR